MGEDGKPQQLPASNQLIFDELQTLNNEQLWNRIKPYAVTSYSATTASSKNFQVKEKGANYFSSEFSGVKKIKGRTGVEAQAFHGLVVDCLKIYIESRNPLAVIYNTQKIDLAREENGELKEIFEVKTSSDTQSVYTAVGQLSMHSAGLSAISKCIVLPESSQNTELVNCLNALGIIILWFTIIDDQCHFQLNKAF